MEYIAGLGLLYLAGNMWERSAKMQEELDSKSNHRNVSTYTRDDIQDYVHLFDPGHWQEDVKNQNAILGDSTYATGHPNPEEIPSYFTVLFDYHTPQYPVVQSANYQVFSNNEQPQPFYEADLGYGTNHPPS